MKTMECSKPRALAQPGADAVVCFKCVPQRHDGVGVPAREPLKGSGWAVNAELHRRVVDERPKQ